MLSTCDRLFLSSPPSIKLLVLLMMDERMEMEDESGLVTDQENMELSQAPGRLSNQPASRSPLTEITGLQVARRDTMPGPEAEESLGGSTVPTR